MIREIINEFRKQNGRHPLAMDNWQENEYCLFHCKHMANVGCAHAPDNLLHGKSETVAYRSFYRDYREALNAIIFEDFANSMKHRNVLLFNDNLAGAFHVEHNPGHNLVFVCVRGW